MFLFQNTGFITGILIDQILTDFIICLKKKVKKVYFPHQICNYFDLIASMNIMNISALS